MASVKTRADKLLEDAKLARESIKWDDPLERIAMTAVAHWHIRMMELHPTTRGKLMKWEELPETSRQCWRAVAKAIVEKFGMPEGLRKLDDSPRPEELNRNDHGFVKSQ